MPASAQPGNPPAAAPQLANVPSSGPNANPLDLFPQVAVSNRLYRGKVRDLFRYIWVVYLISFDRAFLMSVLVLLALAL